MYQYISPEERFRKRMMSLRMRTTLPPAFPTSMEELLQNNKDSSVYRNRQQQYELSQAEAKNKSLLFDYNDPTQINSFADVIFKTFRGIINEAEEYDAPGVIEELLKGTGETVGVAYKTALKPLLAGKPGIAATNTFYNFSETMDLAANPVKGYIIGGDQGLQDALNRKNFDYSTGNMANNIFYEIVSDPLNWMTLGAKALVSTAFEVGSRVIRETIDQAIPVMAKASKDTLIKKILKSTGANTAEGMIEIISKFESGKYIKEFSQAGLLDFATEVAQHRTNMALISSADSLRKLENGVSGILFKSSVNLPFGMAPLAIRANANKVYGYMYNSISRKLGQYHPETTVPIKEFLSNLKDAIITQGALDAARGREVGLPSEIMNRAVSAFSYMHLKELNDIIKTVSANKNALPEDVMAGFDEWAKRQNLANFEEYYNIIKEIAVHPEAGVYFVKLEDVVTRIKAIYDNRAIAEATSDLNMLNAADEAANVFKDWLSINLNPMMDLIDEIYYFANNPSAAAPSAPAVSEVASVDKELEFKQGLVSAINEFVRRADQYVSISHFDPDFKILNNMIKHAIEKNLSPERMAMYYYKRLIKKGVSMVDAYPMVDVTRKLFDRINDLKINRDFVDIKLARPLGARPLDTSLPGTKQRSPVKKTAASLDAWTVRMNKMEHALNTITNGTKTTEIQDLIRRIFDGEAVYLEEELAGLFESQIRMIVAAYNNAFDTLRNSRGVTSHKLYKLIEKRLAGLYTDDLTDIRVAMKRLTSLDKLVRKLADEYNSPIRAAIGDASEAEQAVQVEVWLKDILAGKEKKYSILNEVRDNNYITQQKFEIELNLMIEDLPKSIEDLTGVLKALNEVIPGIKGDLFFEMSQDLVPEVDQLLRKFKRLQDLTERGHKKKADAILKDLLESVDDLDGLFRELKHLLGMAKRSIKENRELVSQSKLDIMGLKPDDLELTSAELIKLGHAIDSVSSMIDRAKVWSLEIDPDSKQYASMVSKIDADMTLMRLEPVQEILDELRTLNGFGADIMYLKDLDIPEEVAAGFNDLVGRLVHKLTALDNKNYLYTQVMIDPLLDDELKIALLDTLQNLSGKEISEVASDIPYQLGVLRQDIENHIMFLKESDTLKLGSNHNAKDDVKATYAKAVEDYAERLAEYDVHLTYDIETTGLKGAGSKAVQIAYQINDGEVQELKIIIDPNYMPERGALITLLQGVTDLSEDALKVMETKQLNALYLKEFGERGIVDEESALRSFANLFKQLQSTHGKMLAISQNGLNFDNEFLRRRAKQFNDLEFIFDTPHLDILQESKRARNHRELTQDEAQRINKLVGNYLTVVNQLSSDRVFRTMAKAKYSAPTKYSKSPLGKEVVYDAFPGVDSDLMKDLGHLYDLLDLKGNRKDTAARLAELITDEKTKVLVMDRVKRIREAISTELSGIKATNRTGSVALMDANRLKAAYGVKGSVMSILGMDVTDEFGNITKFLTSSIKTQHDPPVVWQFFKRGETPIPQQFLEYNNSAKSMMDIRRMLDKAEDLPDIHSSHFEFFKDWAAKQPGVDAAKLVRLIEGMDLTLDARTRYAQGHYILLRLQTIIEDDAAYKQFVDNYIHTFGEKSFSKLQSPRQFIYNWSPEEFLIDPMKFYEFKNTLTDAPLQKTIQDLDASINTLHHDINAIDAWIAVESANKAGTPLLYQQRSVIVEHELQFIRLREIYKMIQEFTNDEYALTSALANNLEEIIRSQDAVGALEVIARKLSLTPDEFLQELYYLSKGRMLFKGKDLNAWDMMDGDLIEDLLNEVLKNRQAYEAIGIQIDTKGDWIRFAIREDAPFLSDINSLHYPKITTDVATSYDIDTIIDNSMINSIPGVGEALKELIEGNRILRQKMVAQHPEARSSMIETIRPEDLQSIDDIFPEVHGLLPIAHFSQGHKMDGLVFNHSILGVAKSRRELLKYTSNNPMKTLATTAQRITKNVGPQTQFTSIMLDPMLSLTGEYYKHLDDVALFKMLKDHTAFRVAFLANDKKRGYVIRHVIINGPKDVEFARSVGGVVVPIDVYNRMTSIVNDFKITNGMIRLMNKLLFQPLKVGMLLTEGFIVRNALDSNMKNIQEHGIGMIGHTYSTIKTYRTYTNVIKDVLALGMFNKENIDTVLAMPKYQGFREMFELYHRFLNDGATGMATELEEYFRDTVKSMLRRSRLIDAEGNKILTEYEIDMYFKVPEEVRETYFKHSLTPDKLQELRRLGEDQDYYRKAYQMHKYTRNLRLQLDDIVGYMKRPETLPDDLKEEFYKLLKAHGTTIERNSAVSDWAQGKIADFMGMNGYVERIVRLASYTKSLEEGLSEHDAMLKVIKVHFDYSNKTMEQLYAEIVFPFSTFAINNFLYWAEYMLDSPARAVMFRDIMTPIWNFDERSHWDMENRVTLQNQVHKGNIILNDEGLTLKINPSIMDAANILTDPIGSVKGRFNSMARVTLQALSMKQEEWETKADFDEKRRRLIVSILPLAGIQLNRLDTLFNSKDKSWPERISPSLFNKTSIPDKDRSTYQPRALYRKRQFPQRFPSKKKYFGFHKPSYKQLKMQSIPFAYSGVKWRGFLKPYPTKVFSSIAHNPRTSNLRQGVNPKGEKLRHLLMWLPTDKYNLKFKLKWINKY